MRALSLERRHQSITDELTGLGNRRRLADVLERSSPKRRPRADAPLARVPLRRPRPVQGDQRHLRPPGRRRAAARSSARASAGCLRERDLLVRLGGDEFVVLLVDGDADYAAAVAQRLTDALAEPFVLGAMSATVSASIGIALAPRDATDARQPALVRGHRDVPGQARRRAVRELPARARPERATGCSCSPSCGRRSTSTSSSCTTSRSSTCAPARSWRSRACCAGPTHSSGWCRRWTSCPSPRKPG